jgi:hypothetical protein
MLKNSKLSPQSKAAINSLISKAQGAIKAAQKVFPVTK